MARQNDYDRWGEDETLLRRLKIFMAVVETGGVGDAARRLGISQPAVSTQIKHLEASLGTPLFRRTGRKLAVNARGEEVAALLRRGLWELSNTLNAVRELSRSARAPLRFGFSAPQIALEAAETFQRTDPGTVLELTAANTGTLFSALDAYELDIIMIGLQAPRAPYHCQFYQRQHLAVMLPRAHPMARRRSLALAELADLPVVLREPGSYTRALMLGACRDAGLTPRIAFEVATREAVSEAVRRGFGVGPVLSREAAKGGDLVTVPVDGGRLVADDYLVCHQSALNYGPVRRFFQINQRMEAPDPVTLQVS